MEYLVVSGSTPPSANSQNHHQKIDESLFKDETPQNTTEPTLPQNPPQEVYFYCNDKITNKYDGSEYHDYQHCIVSLAEGFTKIGYNCYGNINYWQVDIQGNYLIKNKPYQTVNRARAVIVSSQWFLANNKLPILSSYTPLVLIIDQQEKTEQIFKNPLFSSFNLVLLVGYSNYYKYPKNVFPWALGLTERIIFEASKNNILFKERTNDIVIKNMTEEPVKVLANEYIIPSLSELMFIDNTFDDLKIETSYEQIMYEQTGQKHNPHFYAHIQKVQAVAAFAGQFTSKLSKNQFSIINKFFTFFIKIFKQNSSAFVRYDNLTFWDSLATGTLAFQINYNLCQAVLPVTPQAGLHYIGIDNKFFGPHLKEEFIRSLPIMYFDKIAEQGKKFVMKNYSPEAVANRFIDMLGKAVI